MEQANEIMGVFDLFFGFGSIASAGFFYFVYKIMKNRHAQFNNSILQEGIVIELDNRQHPVIEYQRNGKTIQFRSEITAPGVKVGQTIDLELSPAGVARVKSTGHTAIQIGLLLCSIAFLVAGSIFLFRWPS